MDSEFAEFVAAERGRLMAVAVRLTGDVLAAEELAQEALVRTGVHWRRARGTPGAYATTVLVRLHVDSWRRRQREVPSSYAEPLPARAADLDAGLDVRRALANLPPRQRAVVVLRYSLDWSEEQVATALGIARGTVKSQASEGVRRLREQLEVPA